MQNANNIYDLCMQGKVGHAHLPLRTRHIAVHNKIKVNSTLPCRCVCTTATVDCSLPLQVLCTVEEAWKSGSIASSVLKFWRSKPGLSGVPYQLAQAVLHPHGYVYL